MVLDRQKSVDGRTDGRRQNYIPPTSSGDNKTVHLQDNSRFFGDRFEDSSLTLLKTVHRHFFYHVIDIWLENIIDYCEEILMSYDLR